jgi:AcrR family transcriptional regulator
MVVAVDQRERILEALLGVVAARGIDAVSIRSVAAAADVSPAQVQYYFRTKERLLTAAFEQVHDRMRQRAAAVDVGGSTREVLRRYLLTWLPLDEERRRDATVWLAFTAAAATARQLVPIVREADAAVVSALAGLLAAGQVSTEAADEAKGSATAERVRPDVDPTSTASLLLAVVDGVTVRALATYDSTALLSVLDHFLDHIFVARTELSTTTPQPGATSERRR